MNEMYSNISNRHFMAGSIHTDSSGKKVRKPYTITKSRERWSEEDHDKFLEALHLFGRDWKKIEDYVGSKTVIQIRSHAQKYFLKIQKNGAITHVPPPRPKRRAAHPYPQKAMKNVAVQASMLHPSTLSCYAPGLSQWDDAAMFMNTAPNGSISSLDECTYLHIFEEGAMGINSFSYSGSSSRTSPNSDCPKQGLPDFAEVYSFIGSVFDPDTKCPRQKLKQMDPISLKTVLILMRNLTTNLLMPSLEPIGEILSGCNINGEIGGTSGVTNHNNYHLPRIMAGN